MSNYSHELRDARLFSFLLYVCMHTWKIHTQPWQRSEGLQFIMACTH